MTSQSAKKKIGMEPLTQMARNMIRITRMSWLENRKLIVAFLFTVLLMSAAPFLFTGFRGLLINGLIDSAGVGSFSMQVVILLGLTIASGILMPFSSALGLYIEKQFYFNLDEQFDFLLIKKRAEIDIAIHEDPAYNDSLNRVQENGLWRLQNFISREFYLIQNILEVIIAVAILFAANWWLILIILICTIPEMITQIVYGQYEWGIWSAHSEERRHYWALHGHFDKTSSLIELRLFQNVGYFIERIKKLLLIVRSDQRKNEKRKLIYQIGALILGQLAVGFAISWFVYMVIKGQLLIGTFTFFIAAVSDLRQSFTALFANIGRQYQDSLFVTDVFKILDIKPVMITPAHPRVLDAGRTPTITFDNVSFRYPSSSSFVLQNFSLTIESGEKIAIVGVNGAGKTTLIKLLCRFYDPTEGRILIDGYDLREIDIESWYHMLGALFQSYANYELIANQAVALGRTSITKDDERVRLAAQGAEADLFIEEWDKQYEQQLGNQFVGGVEPSVGQWQKLALARAFYRDPRVLVLDEPTSSIDAEAESKIFAKLEGLPKDRTVILISHRFSTVRQADKIVIIEDGKLSEMGTHRELLKENGTYARLFKLQAKGYQ